MVVDQHHADGLHRTQEASEHCVSYVHSPNRASQLPYLVRRASADGQLGEGTQRTECLTAEAQRADPLQIVKVPQLGCAMLLGCAQPKSLVIKRPRVEYVCASAVSGGRAPMKG